MLNSRHFQEEEYDETSRLRKKVNMLQGELRKKQNSVNTLEDQNKDLKDKLSEAKNVKEALKRKIEQLEHENSSLKKVLQENKELLNLNVNPTQSRIIQLTDSEKKEEEKPTDENSTTYSRFNPLGWMSRPKSQSQTKEENNVKKPSL